MFKNGWVKLNRSILDWEWYDDLNTKAVFLHLLLTVNIADETWRGQEIKRGSRVISYPILAQETSLTVRQARTALSHLIATEEVTVTHYPKYSVVSINNYDKFQEATGKTPNADRVATVTEAVSCQASDRQGIQLYKKKKKNIRNNARAREDFASGGGVYEELGLTPEEAKAIAERNRQ